MKPDDLLLAPRTDPLEIYRLRDGFYATDLLAAALVHLDFFSWLAQHPANLPTLCQSLELKTRPVDVMLTLFKALGFVSETNGIFEVTELAREHLVKGSHWYL